MRTKTLNKAKLVVTVESDKKTKHIRTVSVYDNRIEKMLPESFIQERGISTFLNKDHMKETLNWNLNGDSSKYQFTWGQSSSEKSEGRAYIFH